MLILAGVSLNAIIGDNGIITNAQLASQKNYIAMLEEFLQEEYVDCYEHESDTKVDTLIANNKDYFYVSNKTRLPFILLNNQMYYLIDKSKLPSGIRESIKGGDAGNKTYGDYTSFNDVYGVTTDLKVYYCSNGKESWFGADDEKLKDSASRIAIYSTSSSGLVDYLSKMDWVEKSNGNILADKMGTKQELVFDGANLNNFAEMYNFSSLEKLYIKNSQIATLAGIDTAPKLSYIYIEKSEIEDYTDIAEISNLSYLYVALSDNANVARICESLKSSTQTKISSFGVYGIIEDGKTSATVSSVSDLSPLNLLSDSIKKSITNLYLSSNSIQQLDLNGFIGCVYLEANNNIYLKNCSLDMVKLYSLYMSECKVLESLNVNSSVIEYVKLENSQKLNSVSGLATNTSLKRLYLKGCISLEDLSLFGKLKNLVYLDIENTQKIYTLSALSECTTLAWLNAPNSMLGKGVDSNLDDEGNYIGVGRSEVTNALSCLSNKREMSYISLTNCGYILYTGYLNSLYNTETPTLTKLKTIYLAGTSARGMEVSSLAALLNQCTEYTLPSGSGLTLFDSSSKFLELKSENIYLSDFNSIKTVGTQLEELRLYNINIIDDDSDEEILEANYNTVVNNVLKELINLKWVSIRMPEITEISFVKSISGLLGIDLRDSQVGTSNENGLKLLNTSCDDLYCLVCTNKLVLDFTQIQTCISKMHIRDDRGNKRPHHNFGDGLSCIGLNCSNQTSVNSFSNCSDITYFLGDACSSTPFGGNYSMTFDFSNCLNLSYIYIEGGGTAVQAKYKLPDTSTYVDSNGEYGFVLDGECWHFQLITGGGKGAKKFSIDGWYGPGDEASFNRNFEGLRNSAYLKEVYVNVPIWGNGNSQNYCGNDTLEILKTCPNIESFTWNGSGKDQTTGNFTDISALSSLINLKKINISKTILTKIPDLSNLTLLTDLSITESKLDDINGLKNCTSLLNVDLSKNSYVYDLTAIGTLSSLTSLKLSYNAIEDEKSSVANGEFNNINILNALKQTYNKLVTLYIDNNKLSVEGKKSLNWATSI